MKKITVLVLTTSVILLMVCVTGCERKMTEPIMGAIISPETPNRNSGIPFEVTDATFDDIVLGSELPIVVEFKSDT